MIVFSCKNKNNEVFVEKIAKDKLKDENRYNLDNEIYKVGRLFIYDFEFLRDGVIAHSEVNSIRFEVLSGLSPFIRIDSSYNQTVFKLFYIGHSNEVLFRERTGLIENERNVWLHPPRSSDMEILQMNAFPYFKFDDKIEEWKWNLEASYNEYRNINLNHEYTRGAKEYLQLEGKTYLCYIVYSKTTSTLNISTAKFYFNSKFGYMKMKFKNFDGTTHIFTLKKTNFN